MRLVFMGSSEFACASLRVLLQGNADELAGLVCQPDRPGGRHLRVRACPVKALAEGTGVEVFAPERVNMPEGVEAVRRWKPDLIVVVAYGQILGRAVLDLPARGCVNIHGSLLPKYRGAAPIPWAIARGETVTGVTAIFMNERMDAGDIIRQSAVPVDPGDTGGSLEVKLAAAGARLLAEVLDDIRGGRAARTPQDETAATFAPQLSKADGRIAWTQRAVEIHNRVRAFHPWPGCYCEDPHGPGRRLRVLRSRVEDARGEPGRVLEAAGEGPLVGAGERALRLLEVQPEGKPAMAGSAYLRGHALAEGATLR
jgi:methionyl-tRNA formyltransferase